MGQFWPDNLDDARRSHARHGHEPAEIGLYEHIDGQDAAKVDPCRGDVPVHAHAAERLAHRAHILTAILRSDYGRESGQALVLGPSLGRMFTRYVRVLTSERKIYPCC